MKNYEELQNLVNEQLQNLQLPEIPANLYEPVKYILSIGGKRIRPVMCLMAANVFNDDITNAINAALGLEIFHNFTLLHDDIMDKSAYRRGNPTVHKKWNENIAILSGDAMVFIAGQLINKTPEKYLSEVFAIYNKLALQVCEGQQFDMDFETQKQVSIEEYINMITLKTSVLIAGSVKIGAIIGGSKPSDAENLYNFGLNLGLAFQIQDDLLDVYGDKIKFGKPIGNDIVSNKKTYLLISALNKATGQLYEDLTKWLQSKIFDKEEKISAIKNIYDELQIKQTTETKINELYTKSFEYLEKTNVEQARKQELVKIAEKLMKRNY